MGRPKRDKIRITITIDKELYEIIHRRREEKSALINSLLWKFLGVENNKSLVSNHYSQNSKNKRLVGIEPTTCGLQDRRDEGLETSDKGKSEVLALFRVYKTNRKQYEMYLLDNFSQKYSQDILRCLDKLITKENITNNIKIFIERSSYSQKYTILAFRNYLKYCEKYELLDLNLITSIKNKIKFGNNNKNYDIYVPTKTNIIESRNLLKQNYPQFLILFDIMLESGCRFTELKEFILHFNKNNIELWDDEIVLYRFFYIRGKKSSYYLFFKLQTYNRLLNEIKNIDLKLLLSFQNILNHKKEYISAKYLRKYNFTLLIESGVSFEIANFIQGRSSQNIGFNHYLAKKTIAVKEYKKIISILDFK